MKQQTFPVHIQKDATDCGPACLLSLIQFYRGHASLENLRSQSGTNIQGTTLLGLYQVALANGFDAEGCEADMSALKNHPSPVILHVILENNLQHYVVCYGVSKTGNQFIIGDPGKGIVYMREAELDGILKSKTCLTLQPNSSFVKATTVKDEKKKWIRDLVKEDFALLLLIV